jgi:gliding motility-associated-like protein
VIQPKQTITYTLNVVGANGCPSIVADNVVLTVTPPIQVFVSPKDTIVHEGAQFQLFAASAGTDYEWSPAIGLDDPLIPNPKATGQAVGSVINYIVTASTSAGCIGTATVTIRVYKGPDIYVPNAFSPNGNGRNETFYPVPVGIKKLDYFRVFNRWGQLLFSTTTFNQGWDGRMGGKDQANDVYVWMVQGKTETGEIIKKQGTVTLIR